MLYGIVDYALKDGKKASDVEWAARAHFVEQDGALKMDFYQVYLVSWFPRHAMHVNKTDSASGQCLYGYQSQIELYLVITKFLDGTWFLLQFLPCLQLTLLSASFRPPLPQRPIVVDDE